MPYDPRAAMSNMPQGMPQIPQPNGWAGKMSGMAANNSNMLMQLGFGLLDKRQNNAVRFSDIGQQAIAGRQMDQETQNRNMTKEWLMRVKGLSEQDAQAAMANPVVLAEIMKEPKEPPNSYQEYQLAQGDPGYASHLQGQSEQPNSYQEWQLAQGNPGYAKHLQGPESNKLQMFGKDQVGRDAEGNWVEPPNAGAPDAEALGKTEADLRGEYMGSPQFKRFDVIHASYKKIRAAAEIDSGPGDISLVYGFMKMNDPTSTVREGEYATAENAGGVSAYLRNMYNKAMTGERLTPTLRQEFITAAQTMYEQEAETMQEWESRYDALATQKGVSPDNVSIMNIPKYEQITLPDLEAEARRRGLIK